MSSLTLHTLSNIRDNLTERCSCILLAYRRNCAAATSPSQVSHSQQSLLIPDDERTQSLYCLKLSNYSPFTFLPSTKTVPSEVRALEFPHCRKVIHKASCSTQRIRGRSQLLRAPPTHDAHSRSTPSHLSSIYGAT